MAPSALNHDLIVQITDTARAMLLTMAKLIRRHFTATGYVANKTSVLLHWHRKLKLWLPPGGHIEENEDPVQTYEARVEVLKSRGMLPLNFDRPADDAVHRGNLAVAICRILEIKGGVVMRVFKPSRRYAVRELVYLGIYPLSSPYQTFSGGDFVALIGRMEDIQRVRGVPDPPLPQEELPAGG